MELNLPVPVKMIMRRLEEAGFAAYCVGGCVRDSLMGVTPYDWDICTAASPEEIIRTFSDFPLITNGLKHGTVTVIKDRKPYEITTFRTDGEYLDNRRPENVVFVKKIEDDLARRDFTINAMAFSPIHGFADLFGGMADLKNGIIRCVGNPEKRFREDALRIMRMLRFASVLGFEAESETAVAAVKTKELLKNIAAERKCSEFLKLLDGKDAQRVLLGFPEIFAEILPQPFSCDYREAVCAAMKQKSGKNRLATLLYFLYLEPQKVKKAVAGLKMSREITDFCTSVAEHFNMPLPLTVTDMRKAIKAYGGELMRHLCEIKGEKKALNLLDTIEIGRLCSTLKELDIKGADLSALGIEKGIRMGRALERILNDVIEDKVSNDKGCLTEHARQLKEAGEI